VRFFRLRLLFLWLLLLFVLLGDRARGQRERTANQYGYQFFHVILSSVFVVIYSTSLRVTERLLVPESGHSPPDS
jgi:hypothetical protein